MLSVASSSADGGESRKRVLLAGTETDGVLRSEDEGRTWTGANAGLLDLTALAVALSPAFASDRVGFAGLASGLYRTRNGARSWRAVETGLTDAAVQCVAISPTFADDHLVLAGTEADGLLISDDAGTTWHRPAALIDHGVTAVAFSTRYPSTPTIAAAIGSGMAVSDDGGRTWREVSDTLPGMVLSLTFVATDGRRGAAGRAASARGRPVDGRRRALADCQHRPAGQVVHRTGAVTSLRSGSDAVRDRPAGRCTRLDGRRADLGGTHCRSG